MPILHCMGPTVQHVPHCCLFLQALLLNPFEEEPPAGCRHDLRRARLDALDDKERH